MSARLGPWNLGERGLSLGMTMSSMTRLLAATLLLVGCDGAPSPASEPAVPEPSVEASARDPKAAEPPAAPASEESEKTAEPAAAEPEARDEAAAPEPEAAPAPTFTVIARLVDAGTPTSHCGVIHFKVVMKHEVLRVIDGRFEGTTLYAGVSCPEMPPTRTRKFRFVEGATYELKLRTAGLRREGTLVDAFEGEPGKRHELLHIEPAPTE